MTPGVKTTLPPNAPNASENVQPQTGPGDAPEIVPMQSWKQSLKMSVVTHATAGVGTDPEGQRPLAGPPNGVVNGFTQRPSDGRRTSGGGHFFMGFLAPNLSLIQKRSYPARLRKSRRSL